MTRAIVGAQTINVPKLVTVKDSIAGSPPLLPVWNGLAPGGGAGHCQSAPTSDPTPRPLSIRPAVTPVTGASSRHSPLVMKAARNSSTVTGRYTVIAAQIRPVRSSAPRSPDEMCSHNADPS